MVQFWMSTSHHKVSMPWPGPSQLVGCFPAFEVLSIKFLQTCTNNFFLVYSGGISHQQREIPGFLPERGVLVRIIPSSIDKCSLVVTHVHLWVDKSLLYLLHYIWLLSGPRVVTWVLLYIGWQVLSVDDTFVQTWLLLWCSLVCTCVWCWVMRLVTNCSRLILKSLRANIREQTQVLLS